MTTLVIVESPTKAKALRKYLGAGYVVSASMGHVRDLPLKQLGVDVEAGFRPTYHLVSRARKTLAGLREKIAECDTVVLATDPDREGEAIAWHVAQACSKELKGKQVLRARFHEITPEAVRAAIANPAALDMNLVDAQQARRVLDRLVGYQVSPVLWKGIAGPSGLSAGRVQSVALRLVVERDRAIEAFVPEEYWSLEAELSRLHRWDSSSTAVPTDRPDEPHFWARLYRVGGKKPELKNQAEAQAVVDALVRADWQVADVSQERRARKPYPPYITSSLQRDASVRLHWPAKKTNQVAQELYEGVSLPGEGQVGLITYMRTDSTNVAPKAQQEAREVIERLFGAEALPASPPVYAKKVKNAQEAHEAIRPTRPDRLPGDIRAALSPDQDRLYDLIWRRFIASQMKPAVYNVTTVTVATLKDGASLPYLFRATGRQLLDPGFLRVYEVQEEKADEESAENEILPPLVKGDALVCHKLLPKQHFTKPPSYYNDASLIQELEKLGIGRPSTFANIVDTLYQRSYAARVERTLRSTELGCAVCDFLLRHFPAIFEVEFTARMEDRLDHIANGEAKWTAVMAEMWAPLSALVAQAETAVAATPRIWVSLEGGTLRGKKEEGREATPGTQGNGGTRRGGRGQYRNRREGRGRGEHTGKSSDVGTGRKSQEVVTTSVVRTESGGRAKTAAQPTGELCPECGKSLVQRSGKYGPFVGCSGFPQCRYIARQK